VGPKDADANPAPPQVLVPNRWTSPANGTMAAMHVPLVADSSQAGLFVAAYWKCEEEKGTI
jgi:hypothetical protein